MVIILLCMPREILMPRVIQLMAHGIGTKDTAEIVKERCTWLRTVDK